LGSTVVSKFGGITGVSIAANMSRDYHSGLFSRALLLDHSPNVTFENPAVFLCDFEVEDHHELLPVSAQMVGVSTLHPAPFCVSV